jgi:hypothetical protein
VQPEDDEGFVTAVPGVSVDAMDPPPLGWDVPPIAGRPLVAVAPPVEVGVVSTATVPPVEATAMDPPDALLPPAAVVVLEAVLPPAAVVPTGAVFPPVAVVPPRVDAASSPAGDGRPGPSALRERTLAEAEWLTSVLACVLDCGSPTIDLRLSISGHLISTF